MSRESNRFYFFGVVFGKTSQKELELMSKRDSKMYIEELGPQEKEWIIKNEGY